MKIPSHYGKIRPKGLPASEVHWPPPIGAEIRVFYGEGRFANKLYHVRAHVEEWLIAACHYLYGRKQWAHVFLNDSWWETTQDRITVVLPKEGEDEDVDV